MRQPRFLLLALIIASTLSSCDRGDGKGDAPTPPPQEQPKPDDQNKPKDDEPPQLPLTVQANQESIQKNLVDKTCISCHQSATASNRYVELTDISKLIEGAGHEHTPGGPRHNLVKPGCPTQSFFYTIMKEGKMPPPPAGKVSPESLKAVEDWIVSLKPNAGNSCESDEPQDQPSGDEPGGSGDDDEPGT